MIIGGGGGGVGGRRGGGGGGGCMSICLFFIHEVSKLVIQCNKLLLKPYDVADVIEFERLKLIWKNAIM